MTGSRPTPTPAADQATFVCGSPPPSPADIAATIDPSTFKFRVAGVGGMPDRVGHYHITRELGRGGMGVVYEGYDGRLKRTVAVKMVRNATGPDAADVLSRFQTEAEAVAKLHHPHIVQIFEVGADDRGPFVALEYLPGGSLNGRTANKPQPPRDAAEVVRVVAAAMHHAHEQGVVHRDLKPANILFDAAGNAKVTDFGTARLTPSGLFDESESALTRVGDVIGTPQYMAPEQARGAIDAAAPAVDIYALGAVLYQQLTGRPPFDAADPFEVLKLVTGTDPLPPRRLVPQVPRDLETICLKCLEKLPGKRYPTAAELAADLGRFLAGESIHARPATAVQNAWKKARRKPAEAVLIAAVGVVAFAGLAGVVTQWQHAVAAWNDAETSAFAARLSAAAATREKESAERQRDAAAAAERAAAVALDASRLALAADLWEKGETAKAETLVTAAPAPGVAREWEWRYLRGAFGTALWDVDLIAAGGEKKRSQWASAVAVSPDGLRAAVSAWDPYLPGHDPKNRSTLYLIRLADGAVERVWPAAFPAACQRIVWQSAARFVTTGVDHVARVWDVAVATPVAQSPPTAALEWYRHVAVGPDGRTALWPMPDGAVGVWDAVTGRPGPRLAVPGRTLTIQFLGAGVAVVHDEKQVMHVFDPATGATRFTIPDAGGGAISPDGRVLVVGVVTTAGGVRQVGTAGHDAVTGRRLWSRAAARDQGRSFAFSPDGRCVTDLVGASADIRVWEAATGDMGFPLRGQHGVIQDVAFSPDGRTAATAADDGTVQLWDLTDGRPGQTIRGHHRGVYGVAFTPDGTRLVTAGGDGRVLAWDLTRQTQPHRVVRHTPLRWYQPAHFGAMTFTPGGRLRVVDTYLGLADYAPDTADPVAYRPLAGPADRFQMDLVDWAITPDGRRVVGPLRDREPFLPVGDPAPFLAAAGAGIAAVPAGEPLPSTVAVWDGETGALVRRFDRAPGMVLTAAISPDGTTAAAYVNELRRGRPATRAVYVWDVATGRVVRTEPMPFPGAALAFSPDGKTLAASPGRQSNAVNIVTLDLAAGTRADWPADSPLSLRPLAFSPDGKTLAGSCWLTGDLVGWDVPTRAVKWRSDSAAPFTHLAFDPAGRRLATVGYSGTVTLWDPATGREAFSLPGARGRTMDHAHPARVAFSPDGEHLAANQHDGTVFVWAAPREPSEARRRAEADAARFGYHRHQAWAAADRDRPFAVRFHLARLAALPPPSPALAAEYAELRRQLAAK